MSSTPQKATPGARLPRSPGARTLWEIPFSSRMTDADSAHLAGLLDMTTYLNVAAASRHDNAGFVELDRDSGLFLHRGDSDGEWTLRAQTWGQPTDQRVHDWEVLAAGAAHRLDPQVTPPERRIAIPAEVPDLHVGRAANKRLAGFRRHLVGIR